MDVATISSTNLIPSEARRKTCRDLRWMEWSLLVLGVASSLGAGGFTIQRLVLYAPSPGSPNLNPDFAFAVLMMVNIVFCLYYVVSGIFRERKYEILAFIFSVVIVLAYAAADYALSPEHRTTLKLVRLIVGLVLGPVSVIFSILVIRSFGWLRFRTVGPSQRLQSRPTPYGLVGTGMLEVSFMCLGMTNGSEDVEWEEIVVPSAGVPLSIIWSIIGLCAAQRERTSVSWLFALTGVIAPAFAVAQSVRLYYTDEKTFLIVSTVFAGALAVAVRVILYFEFTKVVLNFGRGLANTLSQEEAVEEGTEVHRNTLQYIAGKCCFY